MKKFLALSLALVMVLSMFAGCKKTEDPTTGGTDTGDANKPAEGEGKKRTDLVFAEMSDIVTLDPADSTDSYSNKAINMIFDTLVDLDENSEFIPGLAESWDEVSDTEIVFHLRKGVKFHNGEEMKASDVKFTFDRVKANPKSKAMLAQVESIDIVDDYTVSLKMSAPYAPIYVNLTEAPCHILSEKAVTEAGEDVNKKPVGTGAMMLEEWKVNDEAKLVRFDEHWAGTPVTTSIRLRVIPESSSRTIALENGEVDIIESVPPVDIARLKDNPNITTDEKASQTIIYMGINHSKPPFDKKEVRQAMSFAIDRQSLVDVICEGYAIPATSPFPTIMPSFNEDIKDMYTYDVEKAKALLAQAGLPDGFKAKVYVSNDERNRAAQLVQSDLSKVGIVLDIEMMEFGTLLEYCNSGTHDLFMLGWGHATNQDRTLTSNFHTSMIGASGNRSWYSNPTFDALLEQARSEMDWTKREALYKEAQKIVMDELPWIPLWQPILVNAYNKNLADMIWHKRGGGYYTNAYIAE